MAKKRLKGKKEYKPLKTNKIGMSQMFDDNSILIPYTLLELTDKSQVESLKSLNVNDRVKLTGKTKGKGFAGAMKRWGFSGLPNSHGQKDRHRAPGSIGAQGVGRVLPGKKMPGRLGGKNITLVTRIVESDPEKGLIKVKGGVPGSRKSEVYLYVDQENNEN